MRVSIVCSAWLCLFCLAIAGQASAQSRRDERSGADDPDRPRREGESRQRLSPEELRQRFDRNGDGDLDDEELRALRDFLAERRGGGPPGGRGFGGRGFGPGGRGFGGRGFGGRGFGGRGFGPGGRRPGRQTMRLVEKFDDDGNGRLDDGERARAREYVEKKREDGPGFGPPGGRFGGRFGGRGGPPPEEEDPPREPERVAVDGVELYPDRSLYDPKVLRTFFLVFPQEDWEEEMADFYRTDVDVPANLVVDGKKYPEVGVRFRGNSSFFGVSSGKKRSLNLSIDHSEDGRDLYGYKTLNLLNSHSDPSFLRHILHDHIARQYLPATRSNLVKLVINGESWGVYVNVQQFNKDFLGESFGSREGVRWKIPQGRGGKGLTYNGDDVESYRGAYQLKTPEDPAAWRDLVRLTRLLEETPREELVSKLAPVLDIDGALWFIAVDSVLMDGDGYISRASDFTMYQDPGGRFHLMPYDSNETFGLEGGGPGGGRRGRFGPPGFGPPGGFGPGGGPGGFGPGGGPGGAGGRERGPGEPGPGERGSGPPSRFERAPIVSDDDPGRPIISRLLAVPELRARYLAHVRTIVEESLDWRVIGPVVESYRELLGDEIARDTRKLYPTASYAKSIESDVSIGRRSAPGIKRFVDERREFLLSHDDLKQPHPVIASVAASPGEPTPADAVTVTASIPGEPPEKVLLYHASETWAPFTAVEMRPRSRTTYVAEIPASLAGTRVRYYVEARAAADVGSTVFHPARAEMAPSSYTVRAPLKEGFAVRIAGWLASNVGGATDPQGDHDDWIKLHNHSKKDVDLSGVYLSDDPEKPRKWRFPRETTIVAGGYLVIWADEDGRDRPGFHASFKLSRSGETLLLVDRDDRGNAILDRVEFGEQQDDVPSRRQGE